MNSQNLSGLVSDWSINDLLQIMQVTKKTGSLEIDGAQQGRIHFEDGAVTGADLSGSRSAYVAEDRASIADVIYVLSTLDSGTFAMTSTEPAGRKSWSVEDVLADVAAISELEAAVTGSGLTEATGIRLSDTLSEPITLAPEDWQAMVSLVQPFTFEQLESRSGRGGAVRVLYALQRLGVVEPITSEDESEFLDRLAEGIHTDTAEPVSSETTDTESDMDKGKHEEDDVEVVVEDPEPTDERAKREPVAVRGLAADASTTLTDGVYDEIRRLRSRAAEK
ncbi:MAG TPA: DUF4388 domain-containing protein [Acidimicrobiia bacterium]|nr:DUF4388 domain-containing protein [Acidimicrobiia bacterium]